MARGHMELPEDLKIEMTDLSRMWNKNTLIVASMIYLNVNWFTWSDSTRRLYVRSTRVIQNLFPYESLNTVNSGLLSHLMQSRGISPGIQQQTMIFIRTVSAFSLKMGHTQNDLLKGRKFHREEKGWEEWTVEELNRVPVDDPVGEVIHLAALTGQRFGDLMNLRWGDFKNGCMTFHQSKTGALVSLPVTPEMERIPSVRVAVASTFKRFQGLNAFNSLFTFKTAGRFKYEYYALTKKLGIKKPFHGLRKLCATRMAEAGCTMPEIMAVTGHTSTTTAAKYIRSADKYILAKRAMDRVKQKEIEDAAE